MAFLSAKNRKEAFDGWHESTLKAQKLGASSKATAKDRENAEDAPLLEGFLAKRMEALLEKDETEIAFNSTNVFNDSNILMNLERTLLSMDGGKLNKDVAKVMDVVKDMGTTGFVGRHDLANMDGDDIVQEILETLRKGIETSLAYINRYNPWTKSGKRRKAAVEIVYKVMSQKFMVLSDIYNKNPELLTDDLEEKVFTPTMSVSFDDDFEDPEYRHNGRSIFDEDIHYVRSGPGKHKGKEREGMSMFDLIDDYVAMAYRKH
ncbi:MAG: hypothetical protein K6E56_00430 [Lachnospiraceae bacterium]|nr:hypothetical protein [Lachnospiraceae bacterium]